MAAPEKTGHSWLKLGCFGLLAVVGLLLLYGAGIFGRAYLKARTETVEARALAREVTRPPAPTTPDAVGTATSPGGPPREGRVILDLMVGEFQVEPGEPGEPIRVEARYDTSSYALEESYTPGSEGTDWRYEVRFRETGWIHDGGLRALFGGAFPRIRIRLPPDVPLALEGRFGKGGTSVQLGGLWLTEVDLVAEKGGFDLDIGEPLAEPVETFRFRGSQGGFNGRSLGNASPRSLEVEVRMGGVNADLSGAWRRDADVHIRCTMGGGTVLLPEGVIIEGLAHHAGEPRPADDAGPIPPVLTMSVQSRLGELTIID
jgi:hypothetical protein